MCERPQNRLLWSVKFKLSQIDFPIPQYMQIFKIISPFDCKSSDNIDDFNAGVLAHAPGSAS